MEVEGRPISRKAFLAAVVILGVGVLLCGGAIIFAIDQSCVSDAAAWIPPYPNASVVSEEHNFIRPFGIGSTTMTLHSPDAPTVVGDWYNNLRSGLARQQDYRGFAAMRWSISQADDGGTDITLSSECAWS